MSADIDARLACEHRSMTSSTTELLDFIHTRPGEMHEKKKDSQTRDVHLTKKLLIFCAFYLLNLLLATHRNRQRLPNLVPSAGEQIVLMRLMSRHDVTVN